MALRLQFEVAGSDSDEEEGATPEYDVVEVDAGASARPTAQGPDESAERTIR